MKKIVTMLFIILGIVTTQAKMNDPYHLILEGQFLSEKNIHYTIYKMDSEGTFKSIERTKSRRYYSITCDVGEKYLIRFQDKNQNVKFLIVEATKPGYFGANVDFRKSYDAVIRYTKNGYSITTLTNSGLAHK